VVFQQLMENERVVLMVGTVEPRKGYDQALEAFSELWETNERTAPCLVIVGKRGWKTEALQQDILDHPEMGRRLFWLSSANDDLLEELFRGCTGLLVASYGEGYGLPITEALSHNCPVLARDLPVFREIAFPGVTFYSGTASNELAQALSVWLDSVEGEWKGEDLRAGLPIWSDSASDVVNVLGLACSSSN
jgi:glycosyltransferase involved in cell wall biosynthesis